MERTPGPFWQDCQGSCGDKAQANLTPKGLPVLCRSCQVEQGVEEAYLDQPTKVQKQAFIAKKAAKQKVVAKKAPKPRQVAKAETKAKQRASKPKKAVKAA
jgi:hypothetical protein